MVTKILLPQSFIDILVFVYEDEVIYTEREGVTNLLHNTGGANLRSNVLLYREEVA